MQLIFFNLFVSSSTESEMIYRLNHCNIRNHLLNAIFIRSIGNKSCILYFILSRKWYTYNFTNHFEGMRFRSQSLTHLIICYYRSDSINSINSNSTIIYLNYLSPIFIFCFRSKYHIEEIKNNYIVHMYLDIKNLIRKDLGSYKCLATNSMGHANGSIRVYGEWIKRFWIWN